MAGGCSCKTGIEDVSFAVRMEKSSPERGVEKKVGKAPSTVKCGEAPFSRGVSEVVCFVDAACCIGKAAAYDIAFRKSLVDSGEKASVRGVEGGILVRAFFIKPSSKAIPPCVSDTM